MSGGGWTFGPADEGAAYVARLQPVERRVLLEVVEDVVRLLGGEPGAEPAHPLDGMRLGGPPVAAPRDPALLRLLPEASRDDPEVAAEFRRLTEDDLRVAKVANLRRLAAGLRGGGEDLRVASDLAPGVAAALTDLRLVVAERLGIRTEEDADAMLDLLARPAAPPSTGEQEQAVARFWATLYAVLGILQESLVGLTLDDLPEGPAPEGRSGTGRG